MESGLVSIIIPLWNARAYISQCIESALAQDYPNFEVIVIDDGSDDGSLEIAKKFEPAITLISQPNSGVAAARNYGASVSNGEFLLFLDSDDWIDPTYLSETVPLMRVSHIGIVSTDMQRFGLRNDVVIALPVTLEHEMFSNDIPVTSLIRRDAFPGYRKMEHSGYEDWCIWLDILKRGWKTAQVRLPLFHYRVRDNSMISGCHGKEQDLVNELHECHRDLFFANPFSLPTSVI